MDLARLVGLLSDPAAYPPPVETVEVCHTHTSAVFLAGPYAYKVKKPDDLGSLDFGTLAKRRHFCDEEVRLNRRLAPEVYVGVVAITATGHGVRVEGQGEAVEWAVKMNRLSDDATFENSICRRDLTLQTVVSLAERVASFHSGAEAGPHGGGTPDAFEEGMYTPERTAGAYTECLRRAECALFEGERVIVDASFRGQQQRDQFLEAAARSGVAAVFLHCRAEPDVVRARLRNRRDDASDADWSVHLKAAARWEEPSLLTSSVTAVISTGADEEQVLSQAVAALRGFGLAR